MEDTKFHKTVLVITICLRNRPLIVANIVQGKVTVNMASRTFRKSNAESKCKNQSN